MILNLTRGLVNEYINTISLRLKQGIPPNDTTYSLYSHKTRYIIKGAYTEANLKSLKDELSYYKMIFDTYSNISYIQIAIKNHISCSLYFDLSSDEQQIKYITYVYKDGRIDFLIHFHLFDQVIIEQYNTILLENNIKSMIEDQSISIPNLSPEAYMAIKLIKTELNIFTKITIDDKIALKFINTMNFKTFLENHSNQIKELIKVKPGYYPEYMELTKNDPIHYANLYELGIEYVKGKQNVEEIYLLLANIVISNPGELTKKEKKLVLKYLLKAGKLKEAITLKNRLFWSWAGYTKPPFDIQLDIKSLIKLTELLKKK